MLGRRAGAPEGVKDGKRKSQAKKEAVKPPEINTLGHRMDCAIAEEERSPMDKESDKMVDKDGNTTFKGSDRTPEVDPETHRAGAPQQSELALCGFKALGDHVEKNCPGIIVLSQEAFLELSQE